MDRAATPLSSTDPQVDRSLGDPGGPGVGSVVGNGERSDVRGRRKVEKAGPVGEHVARAAR
jgi:hypothetical protein